MLIAYYCIPFVLIDIARKRQDLPFRNTFVLFSAFIIACGSTHLLEVWTLWHPDYWVSGMMKAVTALISIYTAASLFALTPKILGLPSPELLEIANEALATKVIEHQQAEAKIQGLNQELESRIAERTQALEQTNYELSETNKRLRDTMKELLSAELALIHQKESFQRVLEHIPDIIARFDRHLRHVYVNGAVEKETGIPPQDFIGKTNQEMGMPEDLVQQWENVMLEVFMTQESQSMEFEYDSPHGLQTFQTYLVPEYSSEDAVEYVLALTRNVTVAKALESQLRLAAERDGLTQIPNRRSFDRYLETKWDKAQAQGQTISVLICDVDYFKAYNDCYGHLKGDDILCTVAHTIEQALDYPPYLAARYGGEEFAVVLPWASPQQA
ncbi:MAG: diguanylate cyclase domain-containing protein, partial [Prochlorotrichaceae cyanobacterium]